MSVRKPQPRFGWRGEPSEPEPKLTLDVWNKRIREELGMWRWLSKQPRSQLKHRPGEGRDIPSPGQWYDPLEAYDVGQRFDSGELIALWEHDEIHRRGA